MQRNAKENKQEAGVAKKVKARRQKYYWDYSLMLTVFFLICFGLVMIYSTSYYTAVRADEDQFYYFWRQAIFSGIGIFAMFGIAIFSNYRTIVSKFAYPLQIIGLVCMLLVSFSPWGIEVNGSKRWLGAFGVSFQPTELVKLATILFLVKNICNKKKVLSGWKNLIIFLILIIAPLGLVISNNLSSGLIIVFIILVMYYVSANKPRLFWPVVIGILGVGVFAYLFGDVFVKIGILKEYQLSRINVWKNPEAYATEGGYQVLQGLYAIGSGGFFGKGLGNSTQKLGYVPEARNDMIFSIICEEFGIFGAICLIALFVFMFYRMLIIVRNARDRAGKYLVIGIMSHLSIQVILNIAVVTNMMPNTGVSLPFISYGGSSVLFLLAEIGLVFNVGRDIPIKSRKVEEE